MKNRKTSPAFNFPLKDNYILIDIETTGLRPLKDRICEISLSVIRDGLIHKEWHSLIHTEESDGGATPTFKEVAVKLHKILKNNIIVAHNAGFIYGFLKNELDRCGIKLNEKLLCSMSLSRYLFPESKEHTLKAINDRLFLESKKENRLSLLLNFFNKLEDILTPEDLRNTMTRLIQVSHTALDMDHKDNIPTAPGVYQCYDESGALIYVGKSDCLKKSLDSHFQNDKHSHKEIQISKQIKRIDWLETSGELGTSLLASQVINQCKPLFNRLVEKKKNLFTILLVQNGSYLALKLVKLSDIPSEELPNTYGIFKTKKDINNLITFFINESNLCYHVNNFIKQSGVCFRFGVNKCKGACNNLESPHTYNQRIKRIMKTFIRNKWPFKSKIAIKETCEKTKNTHFHLIDNWMYLGTASSIKKLTTPASSLQQVNVDNFNLLRSFLDKKDSRDQIIELE
jgi:DNA polymerase-3 subunit epsilon